MSSPRGPYRPGPRARLYRRGRAGGAVALLPVALLPVALLAVACGVSARGTVERPPLLGGGRSDEIVAAGARFHVGAPVVLWSDPGGYDASVQGPVFAASGPAGPRYGPGRSWAADPASIGLAELRDHVDLLVLHYDICGISRETFRMLQDERVLSSHFLLDVDGTI